MTTRITSSGPDIVKLLAEGKLTRRKFIERATAMGAAAAIPSMLASADAMAETPKRGGTLKLGASGADTGDSLDPRAESCCSSHLRSLHYQIRNQLVETDYRYSPAPGLAESWEASADASVWTFHLRKGVEFHNGKTFDSADAAYSINSHRGDDVSAPASELLKQVTELKAPDKNTLVFELEGPNADFPNILADYHLQIVQDGDKGWNQGNGTGPFVLKDFEPGVRASVERNPNYWRGDYPYFDAVDNFFTNDKVARMNGLRTGEFDLIDSPDLPTLKFLEEDPNFQVITTGSSLHYTLPMHCDTAPYDNNDVRLALKYAMPREEILQKVGQGYGSVGNDHPIAPLQRYAATDIPQREYDPDKAKYHLNKAGAGSEVFELFTAELAFNGAVDLAILFKESAAKAGINVAVNKASSDGYWSNVWRVKPFCCSYWTGRPTEDWMFTVGYKGDAAWNDAHWKDDRFDELLLMGRKELNDDTRREIYTEMQRIVHDTGGQIIPMFGDWVMAASSKLKFQTPLAGVFEFDGHRAFERWWFA